MEDAISKTPESKALLILDNYEGSNNYILNLKQLYPEKMHIYFKHKY